MAARLDQFAERLGVGVDVLEDFVAGIAPGLQSAGERADIAVAERPEAIDRGSDQPFAVIIEDDRHVLAQGDHLGVPVQTVDRVRADVDFAAVDADEAVDAAKQRRLSRAGGSDDADRFASADVERDSAQHLDDAERLVHVDQPDDRWRSGGGDRSVRHEINRLCWQAPQPARQSRAARP